MMFRWLQARIDEEKDRRQREASIVAMIPTAFEALEGQLNQCIVAYNAAFGPHDSAEVRAEPGRIQVVLGSENGQWHAAPPIQILSDVSLPGFKIERRAQEPLLIQIGLLPGDKLYYKDGEAFLTLEELTRRILDRILFPKLGD
jgi:hypothetical protein